MTTKAQVQRLLRPIAARRDDLVVIGSWIMLRPVRHVIRGIFIDRTSEADVLQPRWAAINLCEPMQRIPLNWGRLLYRKGGWHWDDPSLSLNLQRTIEEDAIPDLKPLETQDAFISHANSEGYRYGEIHLFLWRQAKIAAAMGDLNESRRVCAQLASGRTMWNSPDFAVEVKLVVGELYPLLLANNIPATAALLRSWEATSARNLGIESIWEPTPFPLERQTL